MKKKVIAGSLALLAVTAMHAQTYQLPNVGFENWEKAGKSWLTGHADTPTEQRPYNEPTDWNSSNVKCTAISFDLVKQQTLNGSNKYAQAINKKVSNAGSGYVPYVGSLTLGETWYAIFWDWTGTAPNTDPGKKGNTYAQNGSYGGITFNGRPDALAGDFAITTRNNNEEAHAIAYLWSGSFSGSVPGELSYTGSYFNPKEGTIKTWKTIENVDRAIWGTINPSIITDKTIKDIDASKGKIIAYCDKAFNSTFDWTKVEIPLTYLSDEAPEMTNVIIAAGDPWDSRKSVKGNDINVDNLCYAYFSRLSNASIDGYAFDFNPNTLDYTITVDDVENFTLPTGVNYSIMSNEALTADKEAAVITNDDNKQISIKVTNKQSIANAEATDADGLREHTYNFYFREAPQQFEGFYFTNVNGTDIYSGETTTLTLTQENADYHTYTLAIADVKVAQAATRAAGDAVNVTVSGLTKTEKDGKVIYSGTDDNAKVGDETEQVSAVATFDGDNYEVKFSFTNEDGTVTNVVSTPEPTTSSVSKINGATAAVAATEGAILVSNYNGAAAVYTTDGRLAANAEVNGSASINVAAGLYIVRTGNKATKVIVK